MIVMTTYIQMRTQIQDALVKAGFTKTLTNSSQSILDAKIEAKEHQRRRYYDYAKQGYTIKAKDRSGVMGRPSEENARLYLYSTILRAWVSEFGNTPKVHKKNFKGHPLLELIRALLYPRDNAKLRHHLERYFAYRNRLFKNNCTFHQKTEDFRWV